MKFAIIAACDDKRGIGIANKLPWRLKGDLAYFSDVTTDAHTGSQNAVLMGRKTWDSLPAKHRPLPDRLNIVLSREPFDLPEGVLHATSFDNAFEQIQKLDERTDRDELNNADEQENVTVRKIFVIGGANIYAQAINMTECTEIYLTRVLGEFQCDTFFPEIPMGFEIVSESKEMEENGVKYKFVVYKKATEF